MRDVLDHLTSLPGRAVLQASALDAIIHEVSNRDPFTETGGILLGRLQVGDYLVSVGYLPASKAHDYNSLRTAWNDVIEQGAAFTAAGKFLTPKDVAKLMARGSDSSGSGSGGYTGTKSATSKSVDLTDPETAKAMVNDILSNALGRAALPEELATFRQTLNAAEKANPVTTTTTGTYQDGDQVSQTSTRSGGLDSAGKQQVLLDEAKKTPEYGAYQAARMVLGWLGQAIAAPV